jgi:hypothetical protein
MSRSMRQPILALATLCCGALAYPAAAQTAGNSAGFINSGQTATIDCNGGKAEIMGSNNVLTINGNCTDLELAGSGNEITVQLASAAKISFVGSGNAINWTSADGKPPAVSYVGSGNSMTPPVH